jgi:hypothetical protein
MKSCSERGFSTDSVVSGQEQEPTPGCMHLIDPLVKSKRKEEAMTIIWKGLAPPDHPIYKEGWSIAVQSPKPAEKKPTPAKKEKKPQGKK